MNPPYQSAIAASGRTQSCNCVGPQNGQPKCPCMMRNVVERDGRWIEKERDLGPVTPARTDLTALLDGRTGHGCVCPVGAEATCKGPLCPRRPIGLAA